MTLDSQFAQFLAAVNAHEGPGPFDGTPEQNRAGLTAAITAGQDPATFAEVESIEECVVGDSAVRVQVIRPRTDRDELPTVAYLHPGGFSTGSVELFEDVARRLARDAEAVVVSIDYPLAPEHTSEHITTAAADTVRWVVESASELGGRADQVGVVGESSGATLAACAALYLRDSGHSLRCLMLVSPFTDLARRFPSERELADGYFISAHDLEQIRKLYLDDRADADTFPASPARAELAGLPATVLAVAGYDPLRDDGIAFAGRLLQADVPTTLRVYPGLIHPFFGMPAVSSAAEDAITDLTTLLSSVLRADL